ncbi:MULTISPECIES: MCR_0457 family protein [unclassified Moraxella]|uniref:MCR_0457 family protein n=1 Tax=unclassified Moraxella TaxID=2685852 RepID=UPI003AF56BEC
MSYVRLPRVSQSIVSKCLLAVTTLSASLVSVAAPQSPNATIAIDMSGLTTTKEEVAVLQVLSEICPAMLNPVQQKSFNKAYNIELKRLMPTISDPRTAVQYLSTQQDYKAILNDTRQWTLSYSKEDNKQLCRELATAKY